MKSSIKERSLPTPQHSKMNSQSDAQPIPVIDLTEDDEPTYVIENVHSLLLTYPQVKKQMNDNGIEVKDDGKVEYIVDNQLCQVDSIRDFFLVQLLQCPKQPCHVVIGLETHEDGNPHVHCFVQWLHRQSFPNNFFDFGGIHPNIQPINNPLGAKRYVMKEDRSPLKWVMTLTLDDDDEGFFAPAAPPYE